MGVDLPLALPNISEKESISMNLKLLFSSGIGLPLHLSPGLLELSEYASINMNLKLPFWGVDLSLDLPELSE